MCRCDQPICGILRVKTRRERSNRQLNAQNMLHARVVTSIALLEVLWNISVLKMVTRQGEGVERATSHSLKGKMVGAGLFKLCRGTGGKYHEYAARDDDKPRCVMRSCTNCAARQLYGPKQVNPRSGFLLKQRIIPLLVNADHHSRFPNTDLYTFLSLTCVPYAPPISFAAICIMTVYSQGNKKRQHVACKYSQLTRNAYKTELVET